MRPGGDLLQRLAPDEVVVELDERPVAQLVGRQVVVLDVRWRRSCRRSSRCLRSRSPAATRGTASCARRCRPPAAARESSRTPACCSRRRARRPAPGRSPCRPRRWPRGSRRPRSYGPQISSPGAPAMPCRRQRTLRPLMLIASMLKNLMSGSGPPLSFSSTWRGVRPLDLVAVVTSRRRPCRAGARGSGRRGSRRPCSRRSRRGTGSSSRSARGRRTGARPLSR